MALIKGWKAYRRLWLVALGVFALDQLTKAVILRTIPFGTYSRPDGIEVVPDFFHIVHIGNEGAAWGLFQGQKLFLSLVALVALIAIHLFRDQLELKRPFRQIAFGMLTGGIAGNLSDRLIHGHVIDFLDFHLPFSIPHILEGGRYPTFNVADCGIVIGVFAYVIPSLLEDDGAAKRTP